MDIQVTTPGHAASLSFAITYHAARVRKTGSREEAIILRSRQSTELRLRRPLLCSLSLYLPSFILSGGGGEFKASKRARCGLHATCVANRRAAPFPLHLSS